MLEKEGWVRGVHFSWVVGMGERKTPTLTTILFQDLGINSQESVLGPLITTVLQQQW